MVDREANPRPLALESDTLQTALCGPINRHVKRNVLLFKFFSFGLTLLVYGWRRQSLVETSKREIAQSKYGFSPFSKSDHYQVKTCDQILDPFTYRIIRLHKKWL